MQETGATRIIADARGVLHRQLRGYRLSVREPGGREQTVAVTQPVFRIGSRKANDLVLADPAVSRVHLEIVADEHGYRMRDLESKNGTLVNGVRALEVYLPNGAVIQIGESELTFTNTEEEHAVPASSSDRFGPLVGQSLPMREVFATLERAADSDATILVEGETGTGKELVARAVHELSPRGGGPFVVLDCAAVQHELLDSELFGHEKGAFTGATHKRVGRLEEADGGTLFIDELGELPIELQPKLLRALERREVRALGSKRTRSVDIRVVAATHRDLAKAINRGSFREDLFYRLAVVRVRLPSLRERPDDVRPLVAHLVRASLKDDPTRAQGILKSISEENWKRLEAHPWPGNVRQLRNVIHRTLALSRGDEPAVLEVPEAYGGSSPAPTPAATVEAQPGPPLDAPRLDLSRPFVDHKAEWIAWFERTYLNAQLESHDGNISRAAAASGMDRMYFKRVLKKHR